MSDNIPMHANFKGARLFVPALMATEAIFIALLQISLFLPNAMMSFK